MDFFHHSSFRLSSYFSWIRQSSHRYTLNFSKKHKWKRYISWVLEKWLVLGINFIIYLYFCIFIMVSGYRPLWTIIKWPLIRQEDTAFGFFILHASEKRLTSKPQYYRISYQYLLLTRPTQRDYINKTNLNYFSVLLHIYVHEDTSIHK